MSLALLRSDTLPEPTPEPEAGWSLPRRIGFRFLFSYALLYFGPYLADVLAVGEMDTTYNKLWGPIDAWVARELLGLGTIATDVTGSGDRTGDYVQLLCFVTIASVATAIWSLADRRRAHYRSLARWLRTGLRLALAMIIFGYGFAKIFVGQFVPPTPGRLLQPYGQSSPMGLLWTFMGASRPYTVFAGLAELIGGALLLFRRTTLLGALILVAVMGNVVMLNFAYDVPVKLFSSHLLVVAIALAAPDARRLLDLFVRNRATQPVDLEPLPRSRRVRLALATAQWALVALGTYAAVAQSYKGQQMVESSLNGPLAGAYDVDEMTRDSVVVADKTRWSQISIDFGFRVYADGSIKRFRFDYYDDKHAIELTSQSGDKQQLAVARDAAGLQLRGTFEGHAVTIRAHRLAPDSFLLSGRGFHWINDVPFNR